jgi:hypothetical protein
MDGQDKVELWWFATLDSSLTPASNAAGAVSNAASLEEEKDPSTRFTRSG